MVAGVLTLDPTLGGNDVIKVGNGDNVVFGGAGNNTITVGTGSNVILGGNGQVSFSYGYVVSGIASTNAGNSGVDTITTGGGQNVILQGPTDMSVPAPDLPVWQHEASAPPAATAASATPIVAGQIQSLVAEAEAIWEAALGPNNARLQALSHVLVEVGTLPQGALGVTYGDVIVIDATADGWGWYLGGSNAGFSVTGTAGVLDATPGSAAAGHMDLLSTLLHEMGNVMGIPEDSGNDVTGNVLAAGERRLPVPDLLGVADAGPSWLDDFINNAGQHNPNAGMRVRLN
jgi:Ca2+-binding RTX toxin-like protein